MHSGMLLCGADGSEGDEDLAELVLAHLMREAINEDKREAIHESINANQCQSKPIKRTSPARTPCGSSSERSRAAST